VLDSAVGASESQVDSGGAEAEGAAVVDLRGEALLNGWVCGPIQACGRHRVFEPLRNAE
jgi:hypothetical protein